LRRHSMGGFGPSTGRTVEVCESPETRVMLATRSTPPIVSILFFTAAFLAFVFGVTLIYDNERTFGAALLVLAVALVVAPIIWTIKNR
jgi:hypothetical protein